jgi:tRNA threonylcarbamoyladenosine biosynthesis protein TsaB
VNILAIETSGDYCSAALLTGGCVYVAREANRTKRSRNLLVIVARLLEEHALSLANLNLLVWSAGPGSFTGLRIGASTCQAIAYVHQLPVLSLSSLQVYAQALIEKKALKEGQKIAVAMDARMGEIYWASFKCTNGQPIYLDKDEVLPADYAAVSNKMQGCGEWMLIGDAWQLDSLGQHPQPWFDVSEGLAAALIGLAHQYSVDKWSRNPEECIPQYLRAATQWKKRERLTSPVVKES